MRTFNIDEGITWLHVSDFHTGKDEFAQRNLFKRILEKIESKIKLDEKPDLIFITGDVANKGASTEYEIFDKNFLIPMVELLGEDYAGRIFMVPGNHDVDRMKSRSVRRHGILDEISNFLDPTPEGRAERELLLPRFEAMYSYPWFLEDMSWISSSNGYSSKLIQYAKRKVGVLCLNTAWLCGGEDQGKLSLGIEMLETGLSDLKGCDITFILGHHPIDWLISSEARRLDALISKSRCVYLHGHLHKTHSENRIIGNSSAISIQSGCAFLSRNDEKWVSRIIFGSYRFNEDLVRLRPKKWSDRNNEWVLDSDAFTESQREKNSDCWQLRFVRSESNPSTNQVKTQEAAISFPEGWLELDEAFLKERKSHALRLNDERVLLYFEGSSPQWEHALSNRIPQRGIVTDVHRIVSDYVTTPGSSLTIILGAGGEGKSTAFLQILAKMATIQKLRILWRSNPDRPLPISFIERISKSEEKWLIASDEGDSLVKDVEQALQTPNENIDIHIFLAARDTDWIEHRGMDVHWRQLTRFTEFRMKGLDELDARSIVGAWRNLGPRGLGKLSCQTEQEAVKMLLEAATEESSTTDGAFLGAMLRVRIGTALRDHVMKLMERLHSRRVQGCPEHSLLDAFVRIAVPHAYNVQFLTKSVLAKSIKIDESKVRRRILGPLGEEAAAAFMGQYILTRHRAIAEVASEIASSRFDFDPEEILASLVESAIVASEYGDIVPKLNEWRYLSSFIFDAGDQSLGVRLAQSACNTDPKNSFYAVKLAQLYRQAGQPEQGAKVFRNPAIDPRKNRAFFTEWAACERAIGNNATGVLLNASALADEMGMPPPDNKDAGYAFVGCLIDFIELNSRYSNVVFLKAAWAVNALARRINLPYNCFEEIERLQSNLDEAGADSSAPTERLLPYWIEGIRECYQHHTEYLGRKLKEPSDMQFEALAKLAKL